jgi:hypothetical protein
MMSQPKTQQTPAQTMSLKASQMVMAMMHLAMICL